MRRLAAATVTVALVGAASGVALGAEADRVVGPRATQPAPGIAHPKRLRELLRELERLPAPVPGRPRGMPRLPPSGPPLLPHDPGDPRALREPLPAPRLPNGGRACLVIERCDARPCVLPLMAPERRVPVPRSRRPRSRDLRPSLCGDGRRIPPPRLPVPHARVIPG